MPIPGSRPLADFLRLEASHDRLVGERLVPVDGDDATRAEWLYERAGFGLLALDLSESRFYYANLTAQRHFEYAWDEFLGMPSHLSAPPEGQQDRDRFLGAVREKGFADGYRGVRVAASGRRFWIEDVLMWNVLDETGEPIGQAAMIRDWTDCG
ncbi:MEKHLA domain-containing protein [Saccharopolyspora flava]|uniref:MEKHLA domain-containing protein n=1 Tax=Saccharopolyspora flava TaxID=95161 RepID=A0A1I6V2V0_9PSEU|nr:MEKHLA domain-containing protein [Saccharopolyspora flava]SFT07994.1 MEKHLA domain-containing protein [Saccharopolyspora flava]